VRDQVSHPYKTTGKIIVLYMQFKNDTTLIKQVINQSTNKSINQSINQYSPPPR
jgi:hypothetical protein